MPVTFGDLAPHPTAIVLIRGREFHVRALSSAEAFRIRAKALKRPSPPAVKNPAKGSMTDELVMAEWDADYRRALAEYVWKCAVLTAAVAVDFAPPGAESYRRDMTDDQFAVWAAAVPAALTAVLVDEEIAAINAASARAADGGAKEAEKN